MLNVSPSPTVINIAHGSSNYLVRFDQSVPAAWGPITVGSNYHLYWNVDLITGNVTFGFTKLSPLTSPTAPVNPQVDQHWFDLSTTTMRVWSGEAWIEVARVFAGVVINGNINNIQSAAINTSQVGLNQPVTAGYLMFDIVGRPVRGQKRELMTTSTQVSVKISVGTSGVVATPTNSFMWVRADEDIPAFSLVYFTSDSGVSRASSNPALTTPQIPVGIITEDLDASEIGTLIQYGEVAFDGWDWSAHIGKPLYCDHFGQLTTNRPGGLLAYRVGFVKSARSILLQVDAETQPQIYQADAVDFVLTGTSPIIVPPPFTNGIGERVWSIQIQEASAVQPGFMPASRILQVDDHEDRLILIEGELPLKAPLVHTHDISDVNGLQLALDGKSDVGHNHDMLYSPLGHTHTEYSPLGHLHTIAEVTGLQTALNAKANLAHVHSIAQVTDLQLELDGKSNVGHGHAIADVAGLQLALDGKAPLVHTHTITQVSGLQPALDGKADVAHAHAISDVINLQLALDGKSDVGHTHGIDELTDVDTTTNPPVVDDVLVWDGTNWVPGAAASGGASNLSDLNDVDFLSAPQPGEVLTFNGTSWFAQAPSGGGSAPGDERDVVQSDGAGNFQVFDLRTADYFDAFEASALIIGKADTKGAVIRPRGLLDTDTFFSWQDMGSVALLAKGNIDGLPIPGSPFENQKGGNALIVAGATGFSTAPGGSVLVSGGESVGTSSHGGSVIIAAGPSDLITTGGHAAVFIGSYDNQEGGGGWTVVNSFGAIGFTSGSGVYSSSPDSTQLADKSQNDTDWGAPSMMMRSGGREFRPSWIAPVLKPAPFRVLNTTNTSQTLGSARHHNEHWRFTASSTVTVTIAPDSNWPGTQEYWEDDFSPTSPGPMPTGGTIVIGKHGTGNVVFVAGPGVTINTPDTLTITKQHGKATLTKVGPNQWDIEGNIGA